MKDSNRTAFKREPDDRFEAEVVSFLNYPGGGELLLGTDEDGNAVGMAGADAVRQKITERIRNNISPPTLGLFDAVQDKLNGKNVIRVIIACGRQRPYYVKELGMSEQGCYIRADGSAQPMSGRMIEELSSAPRQPTLHAAESPVQDLAFKQLCIYYAEKTREPIDRLAEILELRRPEGEYSYAAYLLADENAASVKLAVYAGTDKSELLETRELGNRCLITATNRLLDRLDAEVRIYETIASKTRLVKERVNTIALREAVVNAVVHNDYAKGVPLVELFSDRIVVTSCGGLAEGLTETELFECRSMPRNRELMRAFRDIELIERMGTGIDLILEAYDRSVFEFTPELTVVTFPFDTALISSDEQMAGKASRIKTTLDVVRDNPTITIPTLSEFTYKSQSTVSRELKEYQEAGLLRREGARKNGLWIVE
ncbi:MAG: putative DNA binding domain-containing protein [Oscillospiraceae bacterium]|nr:putative DNA binding domain-containing protein [Oscillospiraceae bacterium]